MNRDKGYVGIMVTSRSGRKQALQQYLKHCSYAEPLLYCFYPSDINWATKRVKGLYRIKQQWKIREFPLPKVVYNRCYESDPALLQRLEKAIGSKKCFNQMNRFHKYDIYSALKQWMVEGLPETIGYDKELVHSFLKKHKIVFAKPCLGNQGKGVYRLGIKPNGEISIGDHYLAPKITATDASQLQEKLQPLIGDAPYLLQQAIPAQLWNNRYFDIRALVQKNGYACWSVTNMVSRISYKGCFNTSLCEEILHTEDVLRQLYPPRLVDQIISSIQRISIRAAEVLEIQGNCHLGELSVDFAVDAQGKVWIIECNGKPQKDLYQDLSENQLVYQRPIQYASYLLRF